MCVRGALSSAWPPVPEPAGASVMRRLCPEARGRGKKEKKKNDFIKKPTAGEGRSDRDEAAPSRARHASRGQPPGWLCRAPSWFYLFLFLCFVWLQANTGLGAQVGSE